MHACAPAVTRPQARAGPQSSLPARARHSAPSAALDRALHIHHTGRILPKQHISNKLMSRDGWACPSSFSMARCASWLYTKLTNAKPRASPVSRSYAM